MRFFLLSIGFLALSSLAFGQACPGGFWGNGQCIGACESPLVNPNVDLKFYGWSCLGSTRIICTDGGAYCYPEYTAYDRVYGQYCGVITDYAAGECTFPYLGAVAYPHSALIFTFSVRHPMQSAPTPVKSIIVRNRFWWRKEKSYVRLTLASLTRH